MENSKEKRTIEEMAKCCTYYHKGECCADATDICKCDLMCEMFGVFANLEAADYRKQEWIGVEERLPKNQLARVLVSLKADDFTANIGFNKIDTDRYIDGKWVRWSKRVTHWMPLPEAPKMKGGAE